MNAIHKWVCLITEPPYSQPLLGDRIKFVEKLLNMGDEVILFHYLDGVHVLNSEQFPRNFFNLGEYFEKLHIKFPRLQIVACSRCVAARGYLDLHTSNIDANIFHSEKLLPFVKVVSIRNLGKYLAEGYRVIQC